MIDPAKHPHALAIVAVIACVLSVASSALAQVTQPDIDAAAAQFADKRYAEAAAAYEQLTSSLAADQADLRPSLNFNRGCAQLASGDQAAAERTFLEVDATAKDRALRSAARYNLGQIACKQAEPLTEKEPKSAIDAYRRAERQFRNALADQPGHADAARNIEIVQRRLAKLLEEQKQQEQQQQDQQQDNKDQNAQDQNNPDQQNKDQPSQDQDKQTPDPQKKDPSQQDPQKNDSSGQDQQQGQEKNDQRQSPKPEEQKGERPDQAKAGEQKDQQQSAEETPAQQQAGRPQDHREFDLTAAQILDKEKRQRERVRQLLQLMRSRAAPVEKDW